MAQQNSSPYIPATEADKGLVLRILRRNHKYYSVGIKGIYVAAVTFAVLIILAAIIGGGGGASYLDAATVLIVFLEMPFFKKNAADTEQALAAMEVLDRSGGRFPYDLLPDARQIVDKSIPRPKNLLVVIIVLAWAAAFILGLLGVLLWTMGSFLITKGSFMLWLVVMFVFAAGLTFLFMLIQQIQLYRDVKHRGA